VFALDLTDRKKLEEQFLRAQRVESIGTLAGGIAHDLNNVLGPIILSLELLKLKFADPDSEELISMIETGARRGAAMVSQVLSFARGVHGQRVELQIKHVIRDIQKIANDTFLKHILVRTIIPYDLWTIRGDPTQLHQVLLNLCVNARDAMPGGGTLTISAKNLTIGADYAGAPLDAKPGPYVLLQVEDSGAGIPAEIIAQIFDPFFTTKEVGKGTGLGLATTLGIVKSHRGFILVQSELGQGTTFKVHFPAQTEGAAESVAPIAAELPRGNGEIILVVDDEAAVRVISKQTLEAFGYRVILASDGVEAVREFAQRGEEIAAVFTDITMPAMGGLAMIEALRALNPQLPIVATSGLPTDDARTGLTRLGVGCFLPKPFTAERLLKALRQAMTGIE
jgi:nitrogen-specific signal transduction histidine kinase/CheY-like chemotaxis protein